MRRLLFAFLIVLMTTSSALAGVDNSLYATVLQRHVKDGLVDYVGLKASRAPLDAYLAMMGEIDPGALERDHRLAFYINLYNAATLRLIIDNYPVESIKDIGSFFTTPWEKKVVLLNGEWVTLDHVEHTVVRPTFQEPRVHFALNCSAISCPVLLGVPYEGATLDAQLEQAAIQYINDGENNYLDGKNLYVSKIFDWFSEDFPEDFVTWFAQFARGDLKKQLEQAHKLKVKYVSYDWNLNEQPR